MRASAQPSTGSTPAQFNLLLPSPSPLLSSATRAQSHSCPAHLLPSLTYSCSVPLHSCPVSLHSAPACLLPSSTCYYLVSAHFCLVPTPACSCSTLLLPSSSHFSCQIAAPCDIEILSARSCQAQQMTMGQHFRPGRPNTKYSAFTIVFYLPNCPVPLITTGSPGHAKYLPQSVSPLFACLLCLSFSLLSAFLLPSLYPSVFSLSLLSVLLLPNPFPACATRR